MNIHAKKLDRNEEIRREVGVNIGYLQKILKDIHKVKVSIYGDFCLDAYWTIDKSGSETSLETGLQADAVLRHYYTLGGASNIVANLAALCPAEIRVIGVIGEDIFGRELSHQLNELQVDTSSLVTQKEDFDTYVFIKRIIGNEEQFRIDFGVHNRRSVETDTVLLERIEQALESTNVLILNQQIPDSICNESFIEKLNALLDKNKDKIALLDSRQYGARFHNVYRKINDLEAARLVGVKLDEKANVPLRDCKDFAQALFDKFKKPVVITRGARGMLSMEGNNLHSVEGIRLIKKLDTVGAGDTVTSALALSLGAGYKLGDSIQLANLAAAVTVQKRFRTGTADAKEILDLARNVHYVYHPELADDHRRADYISDTDIEVCMEDKKLSPDRIKHVIFDHDGTISTLRQGWEPIMEKVMLDAILGEQYHSVPSTTFSGIQEQVRQYIDNSTGIQTIVQMQDLVDMVGEFGFVPKERILDKFGYKHIYNKALLKVVNERLQRLKRGLLDRDDFIIKGAVDFLKSLRQKNIKLYLASGTDYDDVVNEAKALGYADLFNGGIYGALDDVKKYSKKMVIERILSSNELQADELAVFGDGPVELLECRKRQGICIGVASDEKQRYGLNIEKRRRLIRAGAHYIIPDFSFNSEITSLLF